MLVTGLLAVNLFPDLYPGWSSFRYWAIALATSLLFFGSILAHELGHSVVALRYGIKVKSITLFVFGGVAQIARDAPRPLIEFFIAVAGPVVSALLGALFLGIYFLIGDSNESVGALSLYLGRINILVAVFNMIPGFPLDGGRVFRAIVWGIGGSFVGATKISTALGRGIGYLFIFGGLLFGFWTGEVFSGLWIAFIGWFLENAASASYTQVVVRQALEGVQARDIMGPAPAPLPKDIDLRSLVENYIAFTGRRCFIVGGPGYWEGLVSLTDIKGVPRDRWATTRVSDIMVPKSRVVFVGPNTGAAQAVEVMDESNVNQVPVVEHDLVVGLVGRDNVIRLIRNRADLKTSA